MKKLFSLIVALVLVLSMLSACTNQPNPSVDGPIVTEDIVATEPPMTSSEESTTESTTTEVTTTTEATTTEVTTTTEATTTTEVTTTETTTTTEETTTVATTTEATTTTTEATTEATTVTTEAKKPEDGTYTVSGSFSCEFENNDWDTHCKKNTVTGDYESTWGTHYPDITAVIESVCPLKYITNIEIKITASNTDKCWNGASPKCELHWNSRGDNGAETTADFEKGTALLSCNLDDSVYAVILNPYAFSADAGVIDFEYTVTVTVGEYIPAYTSQDWNNDGLILGLAAEMYGSDYEYKKSELSTMQKAQHTYDDNAPSLYEAFADHFKVGAAVNTWYFNNKNSNDFVSMMKQFNIFTLENESKPDAMHPSENKYNFSNVDKFVEFGEKYGVALRGHTLVWHSQCPDWFFYKSGTSGTKATAKQLMDRIDEHVTTIVSRYAGKIDTWDVVNEVFNDDGTLRDSKWLQIVGDYDGDGDKYDYIEQAFICASKADPNAKLIINDYNLEWSSAKVNGVYNLVKSMLQDGIQVDGVGLQMHIAYNTDINTLRRNLEKLAELRKYNPGFTIEITEMDMSCFVWNDNSLKVDLNDSFMKQYNKTYVDAFKLFMELSEEGIIDTVVFWGINDDHSWLNNSPAGRANHPFLIDRNNGFKSTYWEVLSLVLE